MLDKLEFPRDSVSCISLLIYHNAPALLPQGRGVFLVQFEFLQDTIHHIHGIPGIDNLVGDGLGGPANFPYTIFHFCHAIGHGGGNKVEVGGGILQMDDIVRHLLGGLLNLNASIIDFTQ